MSALKLAAKFGMYTSDASIEQRFTELRALGLDGTEIGFDLATPVAEISDAIRATGLAVPTVIVGGSFSHSLTSTDPAERATVVDALSRTIDAAHEFGASAVMLSPGWDRPELRPEQTGELVREALAPALRDASQAGVTVIIENLWNGWLASATDLAAFIDSFGDAPIGVLFDTGNAARFSPPQHWVHTLGKRIRRIDLKDYNKTWARKPAVLYGADEDLLAVWGPDGPWGALDSLLFKGDVDFALVASALRDIEYEGWCCAEHGQGDAEWIRGFVADLNRFGKLFEGGGSDDRE